MGGAMDNLIRLLCHHCIWEVFQSSTSPSTWKEHERVENTKPPKVWDYTHKSKFRDRPERNSQHPAVSGGNGRNLRLAIPIYVLHWVGGVRGLILERKQIILQNEWVVIYIWGRALIWVQELTSTNQPKPHEPYSLPERHQYHDFELWSSSSSSPVHQYQQYYFVIGCYGIQW